MDKAIGKSGEEAASGSLIRRLGEVMLFTCVVALSCLAVIAVALAAPFVLAASAIAGLFAKPGAPRGWRPAGA
ncbi:hypothetical protein [Hyphococcus luteus]|uniref:Uncharacterized protein n=1 Tax=Hyphococcus luteus TaxID=2058213 RepID=A0A2S7K9C0_9PROT|nr:hypothetical protein [Marinicaulis flavus]PQA89106.1 hypothetical protein CW354_03935 [Marinicaulis flavus]